MDGTLLYSPVVTKSNLRGTGFISPYSSKTLFSTDGSWNRNSRQELEAETTEGNAVECLAFHSLFRLLSYTAPYYLLRDGVAHSGLGFPPLVTGQVMLCGMPASR